MVSVRLRMPPAYSAPSPNGRLRQAPPLTAQRPLLIATPVSVPLGSIPVTRGASSEFHRELNGPTRRALSRLMSMQRASDEQWCDMALADGEGPAQAEHCHQPVDGGAYQRDRDSHFELYRGDLNECYSTNLRGGFCH